MTVAELIAELKKMPPEAMVVVPVDDYGIEPIQDSYQASPALEFRNGAAFIYGGERIGEGERTVLRSLPAKFQVIAICAECGAKFEPVAIGVGIRGGDLYCPLCATK